MLDLTALVERLGVKRPASSELPARRPAPLRRAPFPRHEFAAVILDQVGAAIATRDIAVAMHEPFVHVESLEDVHVVVLAPGHYATSRRAGRAAGLTGLRGTSSPLRSINSSWQSRQ